MATKKKAKKLSKAEARWLKDVVRRKGKDIRRPESFEKPASKKRKTVCGNCGKPGHYAPTCTG